MKRLTKLMFWISLITLEYDFIYYFINQKHNISSIKFMISTYVITIILILLEKRGKKNENI